MRIHLLAVPNTELTPAYSLDGFCLRTSLMARLLTRLGHQVLLYGVGECQAPCQTFYQVLKAEEYRELIGDTPYQHVPFDPRTPLFVTFNTRVNSYLSGIKQPGDVIATIAGSSSLPIWQQHPELTMWEYSIGYHGIFAPFRVYQSHAWRHVCHGFTDAKNGREFDGVIPPWFLPSEFPFRAEPEDYVAYVGRLVPAKGLQMACDAARVAGVKLVVMGHGDPHLVTYGDYVGVGTVDERNRLLAGAQAVLMPTNYLEPFGNVAAEAQLCGTPVISTDYGGFVESVEHGVSGFRCAYLGAFVAAIDRVTHLDRVAIRRRAERLYSEDAAAVSYAAYLQRLEFVHRDGVLTLDPPIAGMAPAESPYVTQSRQSEPVGHCDPASEIGDESDVWEPVSPEASAVA